MERVNRKIKRIGILTGGGDCPGLNAVIRAAGKAAFRLGWEIIGLMNGFDGLLFKHLAKKLHPSNVSGILNVGGTILGSTNRGNPFSYPVKIGRGVVIKDISDKVVKRYHELGLDALIVIGGDGTLKIANDFIKKGLKIVGIPKTIDNDINGTVITFGYDSAVSTATDAIDKLHTTAESHQRTMVVEVMGRYAGWIALNSGVAGGADIILIPEIPFDIDAVCEKVMERYNSKKNFCIVVVAEGAAKKGGKMFTKNHDSKGRTEVLLGGVAEFVASEISRITGKETRSLVLGHLQRGGHPTTFDRLLGTRYGAKSVELIKDKKFGCMVSSLPPDITCIPISEAVSKLKLVPINSDTIVAAKLIGISFGE